MVLGLISTTLSLTIFDAVTELTSIAIFAIASCKRSLFLEFGMMQSNLSVKVLRRHSEFKQRYFRLRREKHTFFFELANHKNFARNDYGFEKNYSHNRGITQIYASNGRK